MKRITTIIIVLGIIMAFIVACNTPYINKSIMITTNGIDFDYTEEEIIDALSSFQDEKWAVLPVIERLQAIQIVANIERQTLEINQLIAVINSDNTETYESYFYKNTLYIEINTNYLENLSAYDAIHIICREAKRIAPPIDFEELFSPIDEKNNYYYEREVYFRQRYNNYYRRYIYEPNKMWGFPLD